MVKIRVLCMVLGVCLVVGFAGVSGAAQSEYASLIEAMKARGMPSAGLALPAAAGDLLDSFSSPVGSPIGIDYDPVRGGVWIASESGQIARVGINSPYETQKVLSLAGIAVAGDGSSTGVAVLPNGNLLLADFQGDLAAIDDYLFEVNPDTGTLVNYWPLDGAGNTSINGTNIDSVIDVELGPNGNAYVTSANNNAVYEIGLLPGMPGAWYTVAVHTATTVGNALGIDRTGCPVGWWISDYNSTSVALLDGSFATVQSFAASHDGNSLNTGITIVDDKDPAKLWTIDFTTNKIGIFDTGLSRAVEILSPDGDILASGSMHEIQWCGPSSADKFKLQYSLDNGGTWQTLAKDLGDTSFGWRVPRLTKNNTKGLARVTAYNSSGSSLGNDTSNEPFTIEVLTITDPISGGTCTSGQPCLIAWNRSTYIDAHTGKLSYSTDGGVTWKAITDTITGSDTSYSSWIPTVGATKTNCKVKLIYKNDTGVTVGTATSGKFTINTPVP
jgi:hypothetical protein